MFQNGLLLRTSLYIIVLAITLWPRVSDGLVDTSLPEIFYPFGVDVLDDVGPAVDDSHTQAVPISVEFPFFASKRTNLFVGTNGIISFGAGISAYVPQPFPINSSSLVAVWWCDVDPRCVGRIYYRQTTDEALLSRATADIKNAVSSQGFYFFEARWAFIATWHDVSYYTCDRTNPRQTFQALLVTDGHHSFAILNYGTITWTAGAQVGFNAGDGLNFHVVPGSRTEQIGAISSLSNVDTPGRMIYRIDSAVIKPTISIVDDCLAWQVQDGIRCTDIAPAFTTPVLSNPQIFSEYFEFLCSWTAAPDVAERSPQFRVQFLFDGQPSDEDIPTRIKLDGETYRASLHERYLHQQLGKWLTCSVESYWQYSESTRSQPVISNPYRMAIEASAYTVSVSESSQGPTRLLLRSTLPITCTETNEIDGCQIELEILTLGDDIAVRQRGAPSPCTYVISAGDWREEEQMAYNARNTLEIRAKFDTFATAPRVNKLRFSLKTRGTKRAGGQRYTNFWEGYIVKPDILVYRYDGSNAVCSSSGDPRIGTFDGFYYSTYAQGHFVYARSRNGRPFEVQVSHWECARPVLSCVCGVAVREDDVIMALDMCSGDGVLHDVTYNRSRIPDGARITESDTGRTFQIQTVSGNKLIVQYYDWGLNIQLFVTGGQRLEGLCGSFDGNMTNDLRVRDTDLVRPMLFNGQASPDVVDSWRVQGKTLYEGYFDDRRRADDDDDVAGGGVQDESQSTFCSCNHRQDATDTVCGGRALADDTLYNDAVPPKPATKRLKPKSVPLLITKENAPPGNNRRRRETSAGDADKDGSRSLSAAERLDEEDYDFTYRPTEFQQQSTVILDAAAWPTASGLSEQAVRDGCRQRVVNVENIGQQCYDSLAHSRVAAAIVQKCVDDVQMTDDFVWADDKVAELQQMCVYDVMTRNYGDVNDSSLVRSIVRRDVIAVSSQRCEPFDCSGHGACVNGSCVCLAGYVGSDCSLSESAVPSIHQVLDKDSDCDVRERQCRSISFLTSDINRWTPTVSCRITVTKLGGSRHVYVTSARVTSLRTTTCYLPQDALRLFSVNSNFTAAAADASDRRSSEFSSLPPGGAVLRYTVAISNDGKQFGDERSLRVVDTLCMECRDELECTHKHGTCLINGYCFAPGERNPLDSHYACQPETAHVTWTRVGGLDSSLAVIVVTLSGVLAVLTVAVGVAGCVIVRTTIRRKTYQFK